MYALAHNAATCTRDIIIGVNVDRQDLNHLRGATLRVLGGRKTKLQPVRPGGVLTLPKMAPGDNRWIELSFFPVASATRSMPVAFVELVNGISVNGYALVPIPMPLEDAIHETLLQHAAVFTRLAEAFDLKGAWEQGQGAIAFLESKKIVISQTSRLRYSQNIRDQLIRLSLNFDSS